MTESGEIQADTMSDLIAAYPELANSVEIVDGAMQINLQTLSDTASAQYETAAAAAEAQANNTEAVMNQVSARLELYGIEAQALSALAGGQMTANQAALQAAD